MRFEEGLRFALRRAEPSGLPPDALEKLTHLDALLRRWAGKLDLIGFQTEEERIRRYFAEPLAAAEELPPEGGALDIGSGGGSPGLPFAIVRPGLFWTFLEPRRRRRLFLEEASRELGLANVQVRGERFGGAATGRELSAISTRGVRLSRADVSRVVEALSLGGRFLWLSGSDRLQEAAEWLATRRGLEVGSPRPLLPGSSAQLLRVVRIG